MELSAHINPHSYKAINFTNSFFSLRATTIAIRFLDLKTIDSLGIILAASYSTAK